MSAATTAALQARRDPKGERRRKLGLTAAQRWETNVRRVPLLHIGVAWLTIHAEEDPKETRIGKCLHLSPGRARARRGRSRWREGPIGQPQRERGRFVIHRKGEKGCAPRGLWLGHWAGWACGKRGSRVGLAAKLKTREGGRVFILIFWNLYIFKSTLKAFEFILNFGQTHTVH